MTEPVAGFDEALRALAAELDLPEPVRSRTLLELRSDLESMAAELERRGVGAEAARERALSALLPGPGAVSELRQVHRPLYQRLVDRFSARGRHTLERGLLVVLAAVYVAAGGLTLARLDVLAFPSPNLWSVLTGGVLIGVVGVGKLFHLWVAGASGRLRRGLGLLLGLGAATLVAGFVGAVADFYTVAGALADGAPQLATLMPWLRREMVLLSIALLAASAAGVIWLVAAVWIARIEAMQAAALGFNTTGRTE